MQRADVRPLDNATTPVIVCGALAGLGGAVAAMMPTALISLLRGEGLMTPAKLVAASLMGRDALEQDNSMAAIMIGLLITLIAAAGAGALFAFLRRREPRFRLLIAEGVGFGLVLFAALWIALPHINPVMYAHSQALALAFSYALFGAALSSELPLRIGSTDLDVDHVRKSMSEGL